MFLQKSYISTIVSNFGQALLYVNCICESWVGASVEFSIRCSPGSPGLQSYDVQAVGMLIAQAPVEGITLLTADEVVGRYPGPIRLL